MELGYSDYGDYKAIIDENAWKINMQGPLLNKGVLTEADDTTNVNMRYVGIELPRIALKTGNLPTEGTDRYILNIDYEAERESGSNDLIRVDIVNNETEAQFIR